MSSIADHVLACLQEFNSLCISSTIWTDGIPDEGPQSDISLLKLQNELSRFKVWSGSIGAHRKGRSSLDYRLRDASNIRNQVVELLKDLKESLQDAKDILTGQTTPWDEDLFPAEFSDDDSDDEPFPVVASGPSELSQIFAAIVEDINCLFRLSVSIHNPSPHDRFKKACLTDTSGYEPFDVQHVCDKLSKAPKPIAERLGKAISRRRQYFKYRELHHNKLASGLGFDDKDQIQSTVASSLPKKLNLHKPISLEEGVDDDSDTGRSQTSWATSAANPERRKIPALPAEAENGPFECPFCFMMISISSRNLWKKHVFSDLFPYICVELGCPAPDQDFQRRHQWAGHVKKHHWKTWTCNLGCNKTFDSSQDMKRHLAQKHSETAKLTHFDSLLTMCESSKSENEPTDCPLCNERQPSFKQYQRHVGRHQEDLALFALPHLPGEEIEKNDESESEPKSEEQEELESEVQEELEKASSYATRLSNESGDETIDAGYHSPQYSERRDFVIFNSTHGSTDDMSLSQFNLRPWKCPNTSCQYYDYGWPTEEERDRHYSDKHSESPAMYECTFKSCTYKSKREVKCKLHMVKAHGWSYTRSQNKDKKLASISDTDTDLAIQKPGTPLDSDSTDETFDRGGATENADESHDFRFPTGNLADTVEKTAENFDPAHADILYLSHKKSSYTFNFPQHAIRDGTLRVFTIRELAAGMTYVPESFRHLVELSFKDTQLLIDSTPIRNYGISTGDTIKVESPHFRKSDQFGGSPSKDPSLDNGHGTEGSKELEGKAERDKRREEFSWESRQRAMMESSSDQVPVPETLSDLGTKDTRHAITPSQPPIKLDHYNPRTPQLNVRCPTCAVKGKERWVVPGRCCGNCGTLCVDQDVPDTHYSLGGTIDNDQIVPSAVTHGSVLRRFAQNIYFDKKYDIEAFTSTSDPSSNQTNTLGSAEDDSPPVIRKIQDIWNALQALEDELEVGWLPICREAINSVDGSTKEQEERLSLINGIHSDIIRKLRRIEEVSDPAVEAKRSNVVEKVNELLSRLGVESTEN